MENVTDGEAKYVIIYLIKIESVIKLMLNIDPSIVFPGGFSFFFSADLYYNMDMFVSPPSRPNVRV